jgi:hypothetical protein
MASDVFITMEPQMNLEYLLAGSQEEVGTTNSFAITTDVVCGVRLLID